MFCPSVNLCRYSCICNVFTHLIHKALHILIPDTLTLIDLVYQIIVSFRFQIF